MILDSNFPPDPRVENEAISLVEKEHEVFLFCLTYGNEPLEENINGIQVKRYLSNKLQYKLSALAYTVPLYTFLMKKKIKHFLQRFEIQALHMHDIRIADAVFKANKTAKLATVLDLHDNLPEVMKLYPHLQKFPGKYIISPSKWKQKEQEFIKKATKIITVSPEFITDLSERNPLEKNKIHLVPNTIRTSFFTDYHLEKSILEKYKNKFVILYLGDTHLRRGLQTAIAAIPFLKDKIDNLKLVIVGKNTTDTILKKQVKDLNINDFVDFEGWQNVSLFQSYIIASKVCISPLHRNKQHDLAYANKIFQYMSFAKPLLVSDAIAQKRLIEKYNAGLVHEDKNVKDFMNKILQLYKDDNLRNKLGENGKNYVTKEFTWEETSKELIKLYENL